MPTEEARAFRAETDQKLRALRSQVIFLFILAVAIGLGFGLYVQRQTKQVQIDRYIACLNRAAEIGEYNSQLTGPVLPRFPVPTCPADPR